MTDSSVSLRDVPMKRPEVVRFLEWLKSRWYKMPSESEVFACNADIKGVQWVNENVCKGETCVIQYACESGDLFLLHSIHMRARLDVLTFLHGTGAPITTAALNKVIVAKKASLVEILEWLYSIGVRFNNNTGTVMIRTRSIVLLEWLYQKGYTFSKENYIEAVTLDSSVILNWLHDHGLCWKEFDAGGAERKFEREVEKWFKVNWPAKMK